MFFDRLMERFCDKTDLCCVPKKLADRKILKNQKNIINAYHNQFLKSSFSFFFIYGKN